jgi:general stress protein YciG
MAQNQRGLGSPNMDEEKKREIRSKGGKMSPGNFANDPQRASEIARNRRRNTTTGTESGIGGELGVE